MAYTITAAPLPTNFRGTPQQLLEAFLDRIEITSTVIGFVSTSEAPPGHVPGSDSGVWLKNGKQIWVWDEDVDGGSYVPLDVSASVTPQIWVGPGTVDPVTPDTAIYSIWLKIVDAAVVGLFYWNGTAWVSQPITIADGSITTDMLADNSVTTNKIKNGAVTSVKLSGSIPLSKFEIGSANYYMRMNTGGTAAGWRAADAATDDIAASALLPLSGLSWSGPTDYAVVTAAHTLGVVPRYLAAVMRCNATNLGYAVGDEISIGDSQTRASATDLFCYLVEGTRIVDIRTSTLVLAGPTWAKWDLKFYYGKGTA